MSNHRVFIRGRTIQGRGRRRAIERLGGGGNLECLVGDGGHLADGCPLWRLHFLGGGLVRDGLLVLALLWRHHRGGLEVLRGRRLNSWLRGRHLADLLQDHRLGFRPRHPLIADLLQDLRLGFRPRRPLIADLLQDHRLGFRPWGLHLDRGTRHLTHPWGGPLASDLYGGPAGQRHHGPGGLGLLNLFARHRHGGAPQGPHQLAGVINPRGWVGKGSRGNRAGWRGSVEFGQVGDGHWGGQVHARPVGPVGGVGPLALLIERLTKGRRQLLNLLEAILAGLGHGGPDHLVHRGGQAGHQLIKGRRLYLRDLLDQVHQLLRLKRQPTGEADIGDGPQGEDVRGLVDVVDGPLGLLGAHEVGRAEHGLHLGQLHLAGLDLGDAEVEQLDMDCVG